MTAGFPSSSSLTLMFLVDHGPLHTARSRGFSKCTKQNKRNTGCFQNVRLLFCFSSFLFHLFCCCCARVCVTLCHTHTATFYCYSDKNKAPPFLSFFPLHHFLFSIICVFSNPASFSSLPQTRLLNSKSHCLSLSLSHICSFIPSLPHCSPSYTSKCVFLLRLKPLQLIFNYSENTDGRNILS